MSPRAPSRLRPALVLVAFVLGLGLPWVHSAFEEEEGRFCRRGRCCCAASPGAGTRFLAACPCERPGGPEHASLASHPVPAELPEALPQPAPSPEVEIGRPPSTAPCSADADPVDPPPKLLLA